MRRMGLGRAEVRGGWENRIKEDRVAKRAATKKVGGGPRWSEPRQARSRETMTRILDAAESLLADRSFGALTIEAVCERAGSNTGSFYNLFADKQALLECLLDRLDRDRLDSVRGYAAWSVGRSVEERAARLVAMTFAICRERPGVLRASSWASRENVKLMPRTGERNEGVLDVAARALAGDEAGVEVGKLAAVMIGDVAQHLVIFGSGLPDDVRGMEGEEVEQRVCAGVVAMLGG